MNKKVLILAQVFITLMMAILMSGYMSFLALGPTKQWLLEWPVAAMYAWPVAFVLSQGVGPLAFLLSNKILGPKR